jgi:hypothetical protein
MKKDEHFLAHLLSIKNPTKKMEKASTIRNRKAKNPK